MESLAGTNRFPWSFRPVSRPFSGRLKVVETLWIRASEQLMALAGQVRDLEQVDFEIDAQRLQAAGQAARQAFARLEAQCLTLLAQEELRPTQRVLLAALLRNSSCFQNVLTCLQRLGTRMTVIRDQHPPLALMQLHELGSEALGMLGRSLEAFKSLDPSLARAVLDQETWAIYLTRTFHSRAARALFLDVDNLEWITECHSVVHHWEGIVASAKVMAHEVLRLHTEIPHSYSSSAQILVQ